jgi:hypothetical protein
MVTVGNRLSCTIKPLRVRANQQVRARECNNDSVETAPTGFFHGK